MAGYIGPQPVPQATQTRETFTATSGQTTFNTGGYTAGYLDVFLNGVKLVDTTDYTATNGSDVVLTSGAATGDILEVVAYTAFTVADQTFTGDIVMSDGLTVDNDGATVLTADRATSDGTIIDVQKDGTSVGSIGADGGAIYIGNTAGEQFKFHNGSGGSFYPKTDNNNDLGASSNRFKDLYLSGGVFLGGTGSANKLDDYEEGTWTPTLPNGGTANINYASYVKIGSLVIAYCYITAASVPNDGLRFEVGGLPFTAHGNSNYYGGGSVGYTTDLNTANWHQPLVQTNANNFYFHRNDGTSSTVLNSAVFGTNRGLIFQVYYHTAF